MRALEESIMLMQHIAGHLHAEQDPQTADLFTRRAQETEKRAEIVRQIVTHGSPPDPEMAQVDSPGAADVVQ